MDGNGRWGVQLHGSRVFGHHAGAHRVEEIVRCAHAWGIEILTLFAFSTENMNRSQYEYDTIMKLIAEFLDDAHTKLADTNVRIRIIGDARMRPAYVQTRAEKIEMATRNNDGPLLQVAVCYGGQCDIVEATQQIAQKVADGRMTADQINTQMLTDHLQVPDRVDLLIRTGGEHRISNFLLWQTAYAEIVFSDVLWPDFTADEFDMIMERFQSGIRTFGGDRVAAE